MQRTLTPNGILPLQCADILRLFKLLKMVTRSSESSVQIPFNTGPAKSGEFAKYMAYHIVRRREISADTKAKELAVHGLKLRPAVLKTYFKSTTHSGGKRIKEAEVNVALNSDVFRAIKNKEAAVLSALQQESNKVGNHYTFSNTQDIVAPSDIPKFNFDKFECYVPVDVDALFDEENLLYVHFTTSNSWVVTRFSHLTDDSGCIQIFNEHQIVVLDDEVLAYDFNKVSTIFPEKDNKTSLLTDIELDGDSSKLFDVDCIVNAAEQAVESFKDEQEDGYINSDELQSQELHFLCGSEEGLEKMITMILHAAVPMHEWGKYTEVDIHIKSATDDGEEAHVDYEYFESDFWNATFDQLKNKEAIEQAFNVALTQNNPSGYTWEYNDGPYDRASGYDKSPCHLDFLVSAPSAHEQICAKMELKNMVQIFSKKLVEKLLK